MLKFFQSRPSEPRPSARAVLPETDRSNGLDRRKVLESERDYRSRLILIPTLAFVINFVIAASITFAKWLTEKFDPESALLLVRLDIPGGSGLGALAILAAVVIALQVSVRGTTIVGEPERALGRQFVLEGTATLTCLGAYSIFFAVLANNYPSDVLANLGSLFGLLAGATLVAALAFDAASASSGAQRQLINKERDVIARERLNNRLQAWKGSTTRSMPKIVVVAHAIVVVVGGSAISGLLLASQWGVDYAMSVVLFTTLFVMTMCVWIAGLASLARLLSAQNQYDFAAVCWVGSVGSAVATFGAAFLISSISPQANLESERIVIPIAVVFVVLVQSTLLAGRIPDGRGGTFPSAGYRYVTWRLEIAARRLDQRGNSGSPRPDPTSPVSKLLLLGAVLLPPVVVVLSMVQLAQEDSPRTRTHLRAALAISCLLTVALAATVVLLANATSV
jgi:hypothetical protein